MNILLTGGGGYIGAHTAVALLEAGHNVVILDNFCNSQVETITRVGQITGKSVPFISADVRNVTTVIKTFCDYEINAVVHFAGLKAVGESVFKPVEYYANNVQGAINLLEAMQCVNIKTLIFSSSATVYGDPQYLPIDEFHPVSATNPYGRSKIHVEEILADAAKSDSSWRIACLRYFNPVGAHESGLIGEVPTSIPNNLMPYVVQVASGKLPFLNIFGNDYPTPDGTGVRDYIHVMDLAEGHLAALRFLNEHVGWHTINLGTGQGTSVLEMLRNFEEVSGQQVKYKIASRRPGDISACFAKVEKANTILNWSASRGLREMCASTWNFEVTNNRELSK